MLNIELIVLFAVNGRTYRISGYNLARGSNISIEMSCIDHGRKTDQQVTLISDQADNVNLLREDIPAANAIPESVSN